MKNLYCRNSRLTSLCMRALIERYVAGDTATQARQILTGQYDQTALCPRGEPLPDEAGRYIDRFLSIYPSTFTQVQRYADLCHRARPRRWRPIRISRQTVNGYFLKLGRYCWRTITKPYLAQQASQFVRVFDETNQQFGLINDEIADELVQRIATRYVMHANGTLLAEPDVRLRYGETIVYLTERASRYQGLNTRYSREHMAWAFLVNSVKNQLGRDDRAYGAQFLAGRLMRQPL